MLPGDVTWRNWDRIYTDASLWRRPITEVCESHGLLVDAIEPGFPGTSAAFAVTCRTSTDDGPGPTRLVVKFYPPMIKQDFTSEVEVRAALKTSGAGVPFPQVVAAGVLHDRIEWAYIIEAFCPGRPTRDLWRHLPVGDRECVASQIADILRRLHSTPLSLVPTLGVTAGEWRQRSFERLETCVDEIALLEVLPGVRLPRSLIKDIREFMGAAGERVVSRVEDSCMRLIHADVTEDHVLLVHEDGSWGVAALLDFGDAKVGPLWDEWVVLWFGLLEQDPPSWRAFMRRYSEGEGDSPQPPGLRVPCSAEEALVFTLLHRFNWALIRTVIQRRAVEPSTVTSLRLLAEMMWPSGVFGSR